MGSSVGQHCPFLNRRDARCGEHLKLDELSHAFAFCFGSPAGCPVYVELTFERQVRRARSKVEVTGHGPLVAIPLAGDPRGASAGAVVAGAAG